MKTTTLRTRFGRSALALGLCALIAFIAALASVTTISVLPPKLTARHMEVAGAAVHMVVDTPKQSVLHEGIETGPVADLTQRTTLLASVMTTPPVLAHIAHRAGLKPDQLAGMTPIVADVPSVITEPDSERRASTILDSTKKYRLNVQPNPTLPIINVYAQAPTVAEAERLADAAAPGLRDYLVAEAVRGGYDPKKQEQFEQLGPARGGVINGGVPAQIAALTFFVVFACGAGLLLLVTMLRRRAAPPAEPPVQPHSDEPRRAPRRSFAERVPLRAMMAPAMATTGAGAVALPRAGVRRGRERQLTQRIGAQVADWPRTTRLLPWMVAGFMALLWLVPFNAFQLAASTPIDLKLDRLALPFLIGTWVLALAAGGPEAPRIRLTWIHAALAIFFVMACLSLVVDAQYLNQTLEFDRGAKKLTLLVSYFSVFAVVASVVRRTEVKAFLKFNLVLAVLVALGMIWQYRTQANVFYNWTDAILPGAFEMVSAAPTGVDDIGRRLVQGPAEISLEAVAMLSLALPIALVGLLNATRSRSRVLYGLAACLIMAAEVSTYRKSAFMAPIAVVLTLAYYRRRQLVKLAPLAVVLFIAIHVLSPGAFGSIVQQLHPDRLGVATVSDRTADYDAIRPDVWTHLALGHGYGTYDHLSYRILDMEILHRLVEGGVIGVAAYFLMVAAVIMLARRAIRRPEQGIESVGLIAAAAAVGFLVISTLFDAMSFPHVPYIFLCIAGLLAVAVSPAPEESG